jgi:hypothetical protein
MITTGMMTAEASMSNKSADLAALVLDLTSGDFLPVSGLLAPEEAEQRIWSGKAAEVLEREFVLYREERSGPVSVCAGGDAPGIRCWYLYSEEAPPVSPGSCVLFWQKRAEEGARYFARRLSPEEGERLARLTGTWRLW